MPTGGGGDSAWRKIIDAEITEATGEFLKTGLDQITELYIKWSNMQNATSTNSGMDLYINNRVIARAAILVQKAGTSVYGWTLCKYNGLIWEINKSAGASFASNLTSGAALSPYDLVGDIGPATMVALSTPNSMYVPVSGKLEVWAR